MSYMHVPQTYRPVPVEPQWKGEGRCALAILLNLGTAENSLSGFIYLEVHLTWVQI